MLIYGKSVVYERIKSKNEIKEILITENLYNDYEKIINENNIKIKITNKNELDKLTKNANHQGICAYINDYKYYKLEDILDNNEKQSFLLLDGLEDPHNLGAIIRTADATNITGIIIPKNRSISITPTVYKVSTGAIEYVKLIQVNNLNRTIEKLKENNFWIYGTDMKGEKTYETLEFNNSIGVVIGSEGKGISKQIKKKCDFMLNIPMRGHVNSLNASVSASILMYEILRKEKE